jgi:superfamily II DNA or RNA helicase
MDMIFRDYQLEAQENWLQAGRRGVIQGLPGVGKTEAAINIIMEEFNSGSSKKVAVILPRPLGQQWKERFDRFTGLKYRVGFEDEVKALGASGSQIQIWTAFRALEHLDKDSIDLAIFDECHFFHSEVRGRLLNYRWPAIVGLSATPTRDCQTRIGPIVINIDEARAGQFLSPYEIYFVQVDKTRKEVYDYKQLSRKIGNALKDDDDPDDKKVNAKLQAAILERRDMVYRMENRVPYALAALRRNSFRKGLIFAQRVEQLEAIQELIGPEMGIYASGYDDYSTVKKFKQDKIQFLGSCKMLDHGFDDPGIDLIIVVSTTLSISDFIQKWGRGIRAKGNKITRMYWLVGKGTTDENLMLGSPFSFKVVNFYGDPVVWAPSEVDPEQVILKDRYYSGTKYSTCGQDIFRKIGRKRTYFEQNPVWRKLVRVEEWTHGSFVVDENEIVIIKGKDQKFYEVGPLPEPLVPKVQERRRVSLTKLPSSWNQLFGDDE